MPIKPEIIEEMLKNIGLLKDAQIKEALRQQRDTRERLGLILLRNGYIDDENIRNVVVAQLGLRLEKLKDHKIDPGIVGKIPVVFAHHHRVVPIGFDGTSLTVATDNPFNFLAFNNFRTFLDCELKGVLTTDSDIDEFLNTYYGLKEGAPIDTLVAGMGKGQKTPFQKLGEKAAEEEAPVVKLVSLLIPGIQHMQRNLIYKPLQTHVKPFLSITIGLKLRI